MPAIVEIRSETRRYARKIVFHLSVCNCSNTMVSEGKEQAIQHLDNADLAFIAVLLDIQGGLIDNEDPSTSVYRLTFENLQMVRGQLSSINDERHQFEYRQSPKGLKFKVEDEHDEESKQAAAEDDEVKEPKEGKTYLAILTDAEHILILVEINPQDIHEILQSSHQKTTTTTI